MKNRFLDAAINLETVSKSFREIHERGTFTMLEVRQLRKIIFKVVREFIDINLGHMPDKRHY